MSDPLQPLIEKHGDLGQRLDSLRAVQKQEVAEAAYEYGFMAVMEALQVTVDSLERVMRETGYEQCTGACEAWFGALELDDLKRCGDCSDADDFYLRQAKMKAADEARGRETIANAVRVLHTEEIAALQRGDMATILQIEREIEQAVQDREAAKTRTVLEVNLTEEPVSRSGN